MPRLLCVIAACLAPLFAVAQDSGALPVTDGREAVLGSYLWVARPVVVFADSPLDPRFGEQMEMLADDPAALAERDVVVIVDTDPGARSALREKLRPSGFMIVVLAKDGSFVLRKPFPRSLREIVQAIDNLPLRKQEAARQHGGAEISTD